MTISGCWKFMNLKKLFRNIYMGYLHNTLVPVIVKAGGGDMRYICAKEFSEKTGIPLERIRRACRTGVLAYMRSGTKYLLDFDRKDEIASALTERKSLGVSGYSGRLDNILLS